MNWQRFSASCTASLLALVIVGIAPLVQAKSLTFKVPNRNAPKVTSGAASRTGTQACVQRNQPMFRALVPKPKAQEMNYSLTTSRTPTLLVYVPQSTAQSIEIMLKTEDGNKTLYKTIVPTPSTTGFMRLNLADPTMQGFQANKRYQWSVALVCESEFITDKATIEGWIERVEPTPELTKKLETAKPQDRPFIYAEAGIWHEALQSIDDLRQARPQDQAVAENWRSLLMSAGLEPLVKLSAR
jgi:Domain of Unknown Function (DUF928)